MRFPPSRLWDDRRMLRLALFISGTGGNALNLVQACREGRIPAEPALVVSSSASAAGVQRLA
jgi:phosphoribosylglycinamide formyltransferase-1